MEGSVDNSRARLKITAMKLSLLVIAMTVVACLSAKGQLISNANIFNDGTTTATVTMNSTYPGFLPSAAVNRATTQAVFGDYNRGGSSNTTIDDQLMTISGFNAASGIGSIRFYDTGNAYELGREAQQVTIYYSLSVTNSQSTSDYIALNGGAAFTLPLSSTTKRYQTIGSDSTGGVAYDTLNGLLIPAGTKSLLLDFGPETDSFRSASPTYDVGVGFTEIQGFAPVPEPSTYALLAAGGLALLGLARVRRTA